MIDRAEPNAGASAAELSDDGSVLTVTVPLVIHNRGGRKRIVTPEGEPYWASRRREVDSALVKALARAFRWRRFLEEAHYGTIVELAAAECINEAYVRRLLRLTLLAPPIVEAIVDGSQPPGLQLEKLRADLPVEWKAQRKFVSRG